MARPTIPLADRFWSKVQKTDSCWLWQRQLNNKGYGCFSLCAGATPNSRNVYAHRLAWILTHGDIPADMCVLHRCDVPACVNPDHLFLGTQIENIADRSKKQRTRHGTTHPRAKLTEAQVRSIRADLRPQRAIAAAYGMGQPAVCEIKNRKTWRHVPD